jgi:hypothetical protein
MSVGDIVMVNVIQTSKDPSMVDLVTADYQDAPEWELNQLFIRNGFAIITTIGDFQIVYNFQSDKNGVSTVMELLQFLTCVRLFGHPLNHSLSRILVIHVVPLHLSTSW